MAAIPLSEIFSEVQIRARDLTGRDHRPAFIRRIIQHSWDSIYREIVNIQEDFFLKKATISFVAGQQHYNLPADYFKMRQVRRTGGVTDEYPLEPTQSTNKDEWTAPWPLPRYQVVTDSDSNTPTHYYIEARMIGFIPPPATAVTSAVTIEYVPVPSTIISDDMQQLSVESWDFSNTVFDEEDSVSSVDKDGWIVSLEKDNWASYAAITETVIKKRGADALRFKGTTAATISGGTVFDFAWNSWVSGSYGTLVDLGSDTTQYVVFVFHIAGAPSPYDHVFIAINGPSGGVSFSLVNTPAGDTALRSGWNYFACRKSAFSQFESPSWTSVGEVIFGFDTNNTSTRFDTVFDGISISSLTGQPDIINLTTYEPLLAPGVDGSTLPYPELAEWLVIESVLRLQMQTGKPESGLIRLREEVRRNVLQSMPQRQLQRMPHIGDSRRRL